MSINNKGGILTKGHIIGDWTTAELQKFILSMLPRFPASVFKQNIEGDAGKELAKGDLFAGSNTGTQILPVGSADQLLTVDSGEIVGIRWADIPAQALGTPVIALINTSTAVHGPVAAANEVAFGVPASLLPGDILVMYVSAESAGEITGTVSPGSGSWTAIDGNFHNTRFVWRIFSRQYTGLEAAGWDRASYNENANIIRGFIFAFRNVDIGSPSRATIDIDRNGDVNPLVSADLLTLARPGDFAIFFVNGKNSVGNVSPPSGYTEALDVIDANTWTYLAYKAAAGGEKNAQVTITPATATDINQVSITAVKHA